MGEEGLVLLDKAVKVKRLWALFLHYEVLIFNLADLSLTSAIVRSGLQSYNHQSMDKR